MNKILFILQREYLSRVRKKSFIIGTILFPVLYLLMIVGTAYLTEKTIQKNKIALIDNSGLITEEKLVAVNKADSNLQISLVKSTQENLKNNLEKKVYDAYLEIPKDAAWDMGLENLKLKSSKKLGPSIVADIEGRLNKIWDEVKNEKLGIDEQKKAILAQSRIGIKSENLEGKASNEKVATAVGYVVGFLMYFILLIYGSQVMMGVMEEKSNRIAEVIVSSVRPFQLMMGKIIGICLVAITQFLLWVILIFVIYNFTQNSSEFNSGANQMVGMVQQVFTSINMPAFLALFAFYLIGGFMFYASLYAAIGSSINEDIREAQSLSFPITLLIIFSIIMMTPAMNNPTGPIAFWGSILPFSSPIIMLILLPYGVPETIPIWQLLLSMGLLVVGFVFTTWFAGKIYRTGILMYGKKPSWKELIKWAFTK